jgi:hypothetical protein
MITRLSQLVKEEERRMTKTIETEVEYLVKL